MPIWAVISEDTGGAIDAALRQTVAAFGYIETVGCAYSVLGTLSDRLAYQMKACKDISYAIGHFPNVNLKNSREKLVQNLWFQPFTMILGLQTIIHGQI